MTLLADAAAARAFITTDLEDAPLEFLIASVTADIYRVSGSRYPLARSLGEFLHLVLKASTPSGGKVSFSLDHNLGDFNPNLVSVEADLTTAVLTIVFRVIGNNSGLPYNLSWALVSGGHIPVYYPDEWDSETSEQGKLLTVTATHDIASFTADSAASYGSIEANDIVHLIASTEPAFYYMAEEDYKERQKQIAIDLLRLLVVDDGIVSASVRVEDLTEARQQYPHISSEYAKRLKQARYLRGAL